MLIMTLLGLRKTRNAWENQNLNYGIKLCYQARACNAVPGKKPYIAWDFSCEANRRESSRGPIVPGLIVEFLWGGEVENEKNNQKLLGKNLKHSEGRGRA
jgi:hypothetical protein